MYIKIGHPFIFFCLDFSNSLLTEILKVEISTNAFVHINSYKLSVFIFYKIKYHGEKYLIIAGTTYYIVFFLYLTSESQHCLDNSISLIFSTTLLKSIFLSYLSTWNVQPLPIVRAFVCATPHKMKMHAGTLSNTVSLILISRCILQPWSTHKDTYLQTLPSLISSQWQVGLNDKHFYPNTCC